MQTKSRINKTFKKLFFIIFLGDNKMTIKSLLCNLDLYLEKPFLEQDMQKCPNPKERMLEKFLGLIKENPLNSDYYKKQANTELYQEHILSELVGIIREEPIMKTKRKDWPELDCYDDELVYNPVPAEITTANVSELAYGALIRLAGHFGFRLGIPLVGCRLGYVRDIFDSLRDETNMHPFMYEDFMYDESPALTNLKQLCQNPLFNLENTPEGQEITQNLVESLEKYNVGTTFGEVLGLIYVIGRRDKKGKLIEDKKSLTDIGMYQDSIPMSCSVLFD